MGDGQYYSEVYLVAVILVGIVVSFGGNTARGQTRSCVEEIVFSGHSEAVSRTQRALQTSLLRDLPASSCHGVQLHVEHDERGWTFSMSQGPRSAEHRVATLDAMTSWVESWLAPTPAPPANEPTPPTSGASQTPVFAERSTLQADAQETKPPSSAPPRNASERKPASRRSRNPSSARPLQLAVRGLVDLDELGPVWPGAEVAVRVGLIPQLWLGVAAAGAWAIEHDDETRNALRLSTRVGWLRRTEWGAVQLGGGVGIVSAYARKRFETSFVTRDDQAGPFVEALVGLDVDVARPWGLSFAAVGRMHFASDQNGREDTTLEQLEPIPLPMFSGSLLVGGTWELGGSP
jgi:hypothetical protein